jgi:hypothetical protein
VGEDAAQKTAAVISAGRCGQPAKNNFEFQMKILRQLTTLTAIIILISCSTDKENVNGHWHSTKPEWGSYKTLDIDDSITTWNKYQIGVSLPNTCLRKDPKTGKLYLPFQDSDYSYTDTYTIDNDTLKISMNDFSYKYFKSRIEDCELTDRYTDSAINVSLSESLTAEDYDNLDYCGNLFLGHPKEPDLAKKHPDSVFIQVSDVFVNLSDISIYCSRGNDAATPNEPFELVLHADNSVNELFIKRVLEKVPVTIPTYRAVNNGGRLGVSKIVRD